MKPYLTRNNTIRSHDTKTSLFSSIRLVYEVKSTNYEARFHVSFSVIP